MTLLQYFAEAGNAFQMNFKSQLFGWTYFILVDSKQSTFALLVQVLGAPFKLATFVIYTAYTMRVLIAICVREEMQLAHT